MTGSGILKLLRTYSGDLYYFNNRFKNSRVLTFEQALYLSSLNRSTWARVGFGNFFGLIRLVSEMKTIRFSKHALGYVVCAVSPWQKWKTPSAPVRGDQPSLAGWIAERILLMGACGTAKYMPQSRYALSSSRKWKK
jgi:hypothetical protein